MRNGNISQSKHTVQEAAIMTKEQQKSERLRSRDLSKRSLEGKTCGASTGHEPFRAASSSAQAAHSTIAAAHPICPFPPVAASRLLPPATASARVACAVPVLRPVSPPPEPPLAWGSPSPAANRRCRPKQELAVWAGSLESRMGHRQADALQPR